MKNCSLLGTDNVRRQISEHIFPKWRFPQMEVIVVIILQIFFATRGGLKYSVM